MTQTNFALPISKQKALAALVIVLFGAGLILGYAGGELSALVGALICLFGLFYVWKDYQVQKKSQKEKGASNQ